MTRLLLAVLMLAGCKGSVANPVTVTWAESRDWYMNINGQKKPIVFGFASDGTVMWKVTP